MNITGDKSAARALVTDLSNQRIGLRVALNAVQQASSLADAMKRIGVLIDVFQRDANAIRRALGEDAATVAREGTQKAIAAAGGTPHA